MAGHVLIGTSSWTDPTLVKDGHFYPPDAKSAEKRLRFYASQFPIVEVDSTYYFPPSESNSVLWIERTPPEFTFNIKAYSLLTNHPTKRESLYKDLQDAAPADKKNVYREQLPDEAVEEVWQRFRDALMPLHSAGKLGAVLFQFPQWFVISKKSKAYIEEVAERLPDYRVAVEFRHKSWMEERNVEETLSLPLRAESAVRVRGHAAGVRLVGAAGRRRDGRRHRDGAVPRARQGGLGQEEHPGRGSGSGTTTRATELEEWVPKMESLAGRGARDSRPDEQLLSGLRGPERPRARRPPRPRPRRVISPGEPPSPRRSRRPTSSGAPGPGGCSRPHRRGRTGPSGTRCLPWC